MIKVPDSSSVDPTILAAVGAVTMTHAQLDRVLQMTVKTLAEVSVGEALDATALDGSYELRELIKKLARPRLGEGAALIRLRALLERCKRATDKRNDLVHGILVAELDGDPQLHVKDHSMKPLPTAEELAGLQRELYSLVIAINDARLNGFLAEAMAERKKIKVPE